MTVNCIIQARLGNTRLPGKEFKMVKGKLLFAYLLERLNKCQRVDNIIVAVPTKDFDEYAKKQLPPVKGWVAGDELDVASRFAGALEVWPCEAFVRVCSDSPLLDPKLVDEAIRLYKMKRPDIACNIHPRTFPLGQCVEVVNTATFLEERAHFSDSDKEHVTSYFYSHAPDFDIVNFSHHKDVSDNSMVVDTQEDFDRVKRIIKRLPGSHIDYCWQELMCASIQ